MATNPFSISEEPRAAETNPVDGASKSDVLLVDVEFGGGLSTLFSQRASLQLSLPTPHTLRHLISLLHPLASPSELFSAGEDAGWELRPGVLAVVGGEDWEVREPAGMECEVGKGEEVVFISTLHGG